MADKPKTKIVPVGKPDPNLFDVDSRINPDSYHPFAYPMGNARLTHTPIYYRPDSNTLGQYFQPGEKGGAKGAGAIELAYPRAAPGMAGLDLSSTLKHELLHQFFHAYPDAFSRVADSIFHAPTSLLGKGDTWDIGAHEMPNYSVGRSSNVHVPPELDKYIQQSLLNAAQGPEQQRGMQSILSMIPPESLTPTLLKATQQYYNTYIPDIQQSVMPQQSAQPQGQSWFQRLISGQ